MLRKLKKHRFLFEELIRRDFKRKYKGTVLGAAWSMLNPLLSLAIMRLVLSRFFAAGIPHYTTYLLCGTVVFSDFSEAAAEGMQALAGNAAIYTKVKVPKYLFILSKNAQILWNFALTLAVFLLLCALDGIAVTWRFLALFYPVGMLCLFNIGVGMILSALYVFFRDMRYLWTVVTQLLTYVSAIFYSVETFPPQMQSLFLLNPLYLFIRFFRAVVIDGTFPSGRFHLLMAFYAFSALLTGALIYRKYDSEFLYYV